MEKSSIRYVVGIDEAGRGPIAGPVAVGAVAMPVSFSSSVFKGARDSKKLPAHKREYFMNLMKTERDKENIIYAVRTVGSSTIDKMGIVYAVSSALNEALISLKLNPEISLVLLDGGLKAPKQFIYQKTIIRGDETELPITLAGIAAKVTRDRKMIAYSNRHPQYAFEQHKGYGTKLHFDIIKRSGICDLHRKSFLLKH